MVGEHIPRLRINGGRKMLTSRMVKARVRKLNPELECQVRPININGEIRGASGFIRNLENGKIIYINTESSSYGPLCKKIMYREAKSLKDYTGGMSRWANENEAIELIVGALCS